MKKPLGLYIHIPFCAAKCPYCGFCSKPPAAGESPEETAGKRREYVKRVIEDTKELGAKYGPGRVVDTVYIGGGTPSILAPELIEDILEAATIDGAGSLRKFFSITLPYLSPVVKVSISMSIIENFKQFPLFWTMTGGGPDGATTNLAILSYREAFVSMNMGSGAAVTTIWMALMIITIGVYNKLFRTQDMS